MEPGKSVRMSCNIDVSFLENFISNFVSIRGHLTTKPLIFSKLSLVTIDRAFLLLFLLIVLFLLIGGFRLLNIFFFTWDGQGVRNSDSFTFLLDLGHINALDVMHMLNVGSTTWASPVFLIKLQNTELLTFRDILRSTTCFNKFFITLFVWENFLKDFLFCRGLLDDIVTMLGQINAQRVSLLSINVSHVLNIGTR